MKHYLTTPSIVGAVCALALVLCPSCGDRTEALSRQMVLSQISRCGDASYLNYADGRFKWSFAPAMELQAYLEVFESCGDTAIYNFAHRWYDRLVTEDGTIQGYDPARHYSDKVSPGMGLFYFYDKTGDEKYRKAIDQIKTQIDGQPRTSAGAFWYSSVYPHQVWLEGVYMVEPFYAEYASRYLDGEAQVAAYQDIVNNFVQTHDLCFDPKTGLLRHAWDESGKMFWCDPATSGQSFHCFGRALGWYCMALVEVLDRMPSSFEGRKTLIDLLQEICTVLPAWADPESHVWYQVMDQPGRDGNYLESSASAMISYTFLKGIRKGYLDKDLLAYAKQLYADLVLTFITTDESGTISIEKGCSTCGLGGSSKRMGDFAYYVSEPVRPNDAKSVGPFILASLERERLGD